MEYSLAAGGIRAQADRLRLRLGGWSDQDLAALLLSSRGAGEDKDVKDERERVDRAMATAIRGAAGAGAGGQGAGGEEPDTVLIRGLTKVHGTRVKEDVCRGCVGLCFVLLASSGVIAAKYLCRPSVRVEPRKGRVCVCLERASEPPRLVVAV